jgi:phosphoribosylanthranilate isomerase
VTAIKVCGVRRIEDARLCAALGVDAVGVNFWPGTPRQISLEGAHAIMEVRETMEVVAVFVDADLASVQAVRRATGIRWVQLHGSESPELLEALQPHAYKAVGVGSARDVAAARRYGGEHLLLDARVAGAMPGGTGHAFDWDLAVALATERKLTLAGGLSATNVAEAIARVSPFRVDVASGVEAAPGIKDEAKLRAFVAAVRDADARGADHSAAKT